MPIQPDSCELPGWYAADVVEVERVARRVIARRVHRREDVDDLVQDAFVRLEGARGRLTSGALVPYAAVVARNLAHSQGRAVVRAAGRAQRGFDLPEERESVTESVERAYEAQSLRIAIGRLERDDRELILARDVEGASIAMLAASRVMSPGSVRVQLTRVRAKLRLEFVLTFRRVGELPTPRCRQVLAAVCGSDSRRQTALSATDHLSRCPVCHDIALALACRDRGDD